MSNDDQKSSPPATLWIAIPALIAVNALWGLSFPVMKSLNEMVDSQLDVGMVSNDAVYRTLTSSWMIAIRFLIAFVMLVLIFLRLVTSATKREWIVGSVVGFFFYVGLMLQVIGLATIPASRSGFLTSLTAVFMPILVTILFRSPPSFNSIAAVHIALIGVSILTGLIEIDPNGIRIAADTFSAWTIGDTLTTVGALFFTVQILVIDRMSKSVRSISITPGMFVATAVLASLTVVFLGTATSGNYSIADNSIVQQMIRVSVTPTFVILLVLLGGCCSLVSFLWMNRYQPSVSAVQASIIYSIEPVFASCWALILPEWISAFSGIPHINEKVSSQLILGGSLVLLANVVAVMKPKGSTSHPEPPVVN